ncbi:hypothetical protein [Aliikangiella sp. IMCC44632]
MIALIASFFSLFVGPLVYQTFGPMKRTDKIVSGFIIVMVGFTVVFEVLPETYSEIGLIALLLCFVGFYGPTFIEKTFRKAADTTHKLTILLGILGLIVHAGLDGIAMQTAEHKPNGLSLAIVLHRLPVGLTIWWILKPLLGERYALLTLLLMGLATLAGYAGSQSIILLKESSILAFMQSLIAGSLLHVVIHKPHSDGCMHTSEAHEHHHQPHHSAPPTKRHSRSIAGLKKLILRWETIGYILGIATFIVIHSQH